jgi:hypothetical protein
VRGSSRGARGGARWGFGCGVTGRGHGCGEDVANVVAAAGARTEAGSAGAERGRAGAGGAVWWRAGSG